MMRRLILPLLVIASGVVLAQQAMRPEVEKFHASARLFVAGDTAAAAREAREGLRMAPRDPALRALLAEIERRPPPEPSGTGGEQDQPPPPEPRGDPGESGQGDGDRQPPERQPGPADESDEGGDEPGPSRPDEGRPPVPGDGQTRQPGQMTREEAEALLRALGADERRLLRARRQNAVDRHFENDW